MTACELLTGTLKNTHKSVAVLTGNNGCSIVVLEHGGRIIGLFPPGGNHNFFWTSPALRRLETAKNHFSSPRWCNSGGERCWIAPEADFFLPAYPASDTYFQPRQMDPGNYRMKYDNGNIALKNNMIIHSYRTDENIALRLTKSIAPAANPLAVSGQNRTDIDFAGYSVQSLLEFVDAPSREPIGLWQLLQLPHGGEMLQPSFSQLEPEICFGTPSELVIGSHGVRWRMRAAGEHKIGFRSVALAGRTGYLRQDNRNAILIIMNFPLNASACYAGYPARNVWEPGYMVECCSVSNPALGNFSELEYHLPAIGGNTDTKAAGGNHQVWAFAGTPDRISELAGQLLGIS
ncbi:MAG: hypothetical protein PHV59_06180 [Victivallales bacterium]|nr:hypothetical protein [Victivallales bacterium]